MFVARDKNEDLYLYNIKPIRDNVFEDWDACFGGFSMPLASILFPELTWEDEPMKVFLITGEEMSKLFSYYGNL